MKKLFALMLMFTGLFITSQTQAQRATVIPLAVGDTLTDAGTASKVITATAGYSGAAVQVVLTKFSGTGAGTVVIQGSNDGTNYETIGSSFTITNVSSQNHTFYVAAPLPVYLKVLATGSGTESVLLQVKYVLRKYNN